MSREPGIVTAPPRVRAAWNVPLLRNLGLLLAFKALALTVLWLLYFSDAHRPATDVASVGRVLAIPAATGLQERASAPEALP